MAGWGACTCTIKYDANLPIECKLGGYVHGVTTACRRRADGYGRSCRNAATARNCYKDAHYCERNRHTLRERVSANRCNLIGGRTARFRKALPALTANSLSLTAHYTWATTRNHTSGTFSQASWMVAMVIPHDQIGGIGAASFATGAATTTPNYPALTLTSDDNRAAVIDVKITGAAQTPLRCL